MSSYQRKLTILANRTESDVMKFNELRFARQITLLAPAAIAGTVTVEVTQDRTLGAGWTTLQSAGTDINLAAGKATVISAAGWAGLRLATDTAPTSNEEYGVTVLEQQP